MVRLCLLSDFRTANMMNAEREYRSMPSACWDPLSQVRLPLRVALVMIMIGITPLSAQVVINGAGVTITVAAGTQLVVEGGAQLNAAAVFENDGAVRVLGDWTNNSGGLGFNATSTGSVYLQNPLPQVVQGTATTDFRNLVISGGAKTLLRNAQCGTVAQPDGSLTLTSGTLLLNTRTFTLYNPLSSALVDGGGSVRSETADLLSRFQWALGSDISEHVVPFTSPDGTTLPFAYTPAAPLPGNTLLGVATYHSAPDNTPYPVTVSQQVLNMAGAGVVDNSPATVDRFWLTDLPNGNFTGTLRLSYCPLDDPSLGPGPVRAQRWLESSSTWQYPPLPGQSNPAMREVLVPNVVFTDATTPTNEHIWAMAYDYSPLPVELLSFQARCEDREMIVSWRTASEQQSASFTVERSSNGTIWSAIGTVSAAGHSVQPVQYSIVDRSGLSEGGLLYRLLQQDTDGTITLLSTVVAVECPTTGLFLFPNPANDVVFARYPADIATDAHIIVHDASGRTVFAGAIGRSTALNVDSFAPGVYHVSVVVAGGTWSGTGHFVKE